MNKYFDILENGVFMVESGNEECEEEPRDVRLKLEVLE